MFLTNEQIKSIAAGYVDVQELEDGLYFRRMNDAHRAIYDPNHKFYGASAFTGSVMLEFYTDSDFVTVTMTGNRRQSLKFVRLDLLVDGAIVAHGQDEYEPEEGLALIPFKPMTLTASLPAGEHKVAVYLPYINEGHIHSVELSDGASFRPCKRGKKWIAFGDSITNGSQAVHPSMTYVNQLARMLDAEAYNFGIGGEYFWEEKIVPGNYPQCDFVTVAYGTNDYRIKDEAFFSCQMPAFLKKLAAEFPNKPTFVILPIWRASEDDGVTYELGTLQSVRDRIAQEAAKYPNMTVIDTRNFVAHYGSFYGDKVLHPNDLGMSQYAMHLYAALKDLV